MPVPALRLLKCYQPPLVEPLEAEAADAALLISVLADAELLVSVLADTELLASALPDTELVSSKPGLKVVVIANVVDICGVAARLTLGVVDRVRLGVPVKVLDKAGVAVKALVNGSIKFFIKFKFLLNDFIADIILLDPRIGRIPIKAILELVPLPIFIPPCIIMKLCVQFSIDLHSRHSDFIYQNANNKIFPISMVCYMFLVSSIFHKNSKEPGRRIRIWVL